ncbi:MAG: HAD family hydrolase [Candidatus Hodarchaeales archaeon]|jgi:phosphoserine phosphatase
MKSNASKPLGLACIDLDGTLTGNRSSWQFIFESLGIWESVGINNLERFLNGEIDYETFAELDVAAWKGLEENRYIQILETIPLNEGIDRLVDFFHQNNYQAYIVSAGLYRFARLISERFGFDGFFGNEVEINGGILTGKMKRISVDWDGKKTIVKELKRNFNVPTSRVVAIGDSSGDLKMFDESAITVAVNSSEKAVINAATISIELQDFRVLIPLLEKELRSLKG